MKCWSEIRAPVVPDWKYRQFTGSPWQYALTRNGLVNFLFFNRGPLSCAFPSCITVEYGQCIDRYQSRSGGMPDEARKYAALFAAVLRMQIRNPSMGEVNAVPQKASQAASSATPALLGMTATATSTEGSPSTWVHGFLIDRVFGTELQPPLQGLFHRPVHDVEYDDSRMGRPRKGDESCSRRKSLGMLARHGKHC